jgi:putative membrane protein
VTPDRPRFLDEEPPAAPAGPAAAPPAPSPRPPPDRPPAGPRLLAPDPDAPAALQAQWQPEDLLTPGPGGTSRPWGVPWGLIGVAVLLGGLAGCAVLDAGLALAARSPALGMAAAALLGLGLGLIGHGLAGEWRGYRRLRSVERLRATLTDPVGGLETLRAGALGWLEQTTLAPPEAAAAIGIIRAAATVAEIQAVLHNRAGEPLRAAARAAGRRAALQTAGLIAISPHASWDGLIAGLRGVLLIREVARLFGLRPGAAVTLSLLRRLAWTAAATAGIELLSQQLADQALSALPLARHIAAAVPGGSLAAMRLYRLASLTAEACCPVSR